MSLDPLKEELFGTFLELATLVCKRIEQKTGSTTLRRVQVPVVRFEKNGAVEDVVERVTTRPFWDGYHDEKWYGQPQVVQLTIAFANAGILERGNWSGADGKPIADPGDAVVAGMLVPELIFPTLRAVASSNQFFPPKEVLRREFDREWAYWHQEVFHYSIMAPLVNFKAESPSVQLTNGFEIVGMTSDDKGFFDDVMRPVEGDISRQNLMRISHQVKGPATCSRKAQVDLKDGSRIARHCVTALRLIASGDVGAPLIGARCLDNLRTPGGAGNFLTEFKVPYAMDYDLTADSEPVFQAIFGQLEQVHAEAKFEHGLKLPLRRFNTSYTRDFHEDTLIDLAISIEAALLHGRDTGNNSTVTALRAAALLAGHQNPETIATAVHAVFAARNRVVHQGETMDTMKRPGVFDKLNPPLKSAYEIVGVAEELARAILAECLRLMCLGPDLGTILKRLDQSVYAALAKSATT
jgi:hypothetical protein